MRRVAERGALDDSSDDSRDRGRLQPEALLGVVETALADALRLAAEAERWKIVAQPAEELAKRRDGRRATSEAEASATLATRRRAR